MHFVGVGTPQQKESYAADLTFVSAAIDSLLPYLSAGDIVAGKSTVPVGTAAALAARVAPTGATLIWNPEFLREGFAVQDTIDPDRVVAGVPFDAATGAPSAEGDEAGRLLRQVYHTALAKQTPFIVTDLATAELVKVAANAFLATKISFINAMAARSQRSPERTSPHSLTRLGMTLVSADASWEPVSASAAAAFQRTFAHSLPEQKS